MIFKNKYYNDLSVNVHISEFASETEHAEFQIMLSVNDSMLTFEEQYRRILEAYIKVVKEELPDNSVAVFRRYFLSDAANQSDLVMDWECENADAALSIVQQPPLNGSKIAMWTYLQTGVSAERLKNGMLKVSFGDYTHYWTGSNFNKASNSEYQTRLLLNDYIMQLTEQGCSLYNNCIRTWFFVQNVDVNYAGVVKARKEVFVTQNLTEKTHYIASTGIEGRHALPEVTVQMDTYAVNGIEESQIKYLYGSTHLNPTYEYGVTFERGTVVSYPDRKHIFISGTASIDNKGEILHPGNIRKQTERMLENVEVLMNEAGSSLSDIAQAIVYLRDTADYSVVKKIFSDKSFEFPYLIVHAPVCRPGWLIEMECIGMKR